MPEEWIDTDNGFIEGHRDIEGWGGLTVEYDI